jgi:hypothetical protein
MARPNRPCHFSETTVLQSIPIVLGKRLFFDVLGARCDDGVRNGDTPMLTNSTSFDVSALTRPFIPSIDPRRQTRTIDGITYKIASCQEEREAAFRLVHDAYVTAELMDPNAYRMRVTPWHLLPTTDNAVKRLGTMDVHVQGFQGVRCDNG